MHSRRTMHVDKSIIVILILLLLTSLIEELHNLFEASIDAFKHSTSGQRDKCEINKPCNTNRSLHIQLSHLIRWTQMLQLQPPRAEISIGLQHPFLPITAGTIAMTPCSGPQTRDCEELYQSYVENSFYLQILQCPCLVLNDFVRKRCSVALTN